MSGPNDPSQGLLAAPHFYWGCCPVCKQAGSAEAPLKRCSRCHLIFYCSADHQKRHWKRHKPLCVYFSSAAEEVGIENFFSEGPPSSSDTQEDGEDEKKSNAAPANGQRETEEAGAVATTAAGVKAWKDFRVRALLTAEVLMNSSLEQWEKEMFLFPRVCRGCHKAKQAKELTDCYKCGSAAFCSEQLPCGRVGRLAHADYCQELRYAMACDNFECTVSVAAPALPSDIDATYQPLPDNMATYLTQNLGDDASTAAANVNNGCGLVLMERKFLSDRVSGPLTLIAAMQRFGLAKGRRVEDAKELTLHLVGANVTEMLGLIKWELVLHKLPKCRRLHLVFVGPELDGEEEEGEVSGVGQCPECSRAGRRVIHDIRRRTYQSYAADKVNFRPPDLVAALNCGFHEFEAQPEKETWRPALPHLVAREGVPLVFSSYTQREARKDLDLIMSLDKSIQVDCGAQRNPYRSQRPIRDFVAEDGVDVFYNNNFYSVVRLKSSDSPSPSEKPNAK